MRHVCLILLGLAMLQCAQAQTFDAFLARVNGAPNDQRAAIIDSFLAAVGEFPYIEFDTLAHFVYRGAANSATVPGDFNNWNPNAWSMIRVSGTDFWYFTRAFESDARLDYKFVLNGSNWILDPRNPHQISGGFGPNSELRMPAWVFPPEVLLYNDIPHGALRDTTLHSPQLGNSRTVRVYTPPDYDSTQDHYPVILFHDGLEYVSLAQANRVLDYLIAHRRIEPVIAVFVPPVNRTPEYAGNQMEPFTSFIVETVMGWVDARYRTRTEAAARAVMGASNGGNISLWIGVQHPEEFGNVAAQSSNVIGSISSTLQTGPMLDLRFYLDLGTYDIPVLIPLVRNLRDILQQRGYEYRYQELHEGHSWGNWRAHIDDALQMFFPGDSATSASDHSLPASPLLLENFPNPFNPRTTVAFELPAAGPVRIEVFDIGGRIIATLVDTALAAGRHELQFSGDDLASGTYFCRLQTPRGTQVRQMLLLR